MAKPSLDRIQRELDRIGLLMQHDVELPSVTTLAVGEPVRGSWWADPRCHEIYDLMQQFDEHTGVLCVKLINGKVTYVQARLWPALLAIAQDPTPKRLRGLSRVALRLRDRVHAETSLRADELRKSGFAAPPDLTKAIRELELKLLVHTDEIHTDSGAHAKVLRTWSSWAAERGVTAGGLSVAEGKRELGQAVDALCAGVRRRPKLPW